LPCAWLPLYTLKIKQQLPPDRVNHRPVATESEPRSGPHQTCFKQRIGHAGHGLHGHNGVPDRCRWYILFSQDAQDPQLSEILKGVTLLLGNEAGSLPPLQLAGTDLQNPQHILAPIAGHSSVLPWLVPVSFGFPKLHFQLEYPIPILDMALGTATEAPLLLRLCQEYAWISSRGSRDQ
jgi:hypothetical protein